MDEIIKFKPFQAILLFTGDNQIHTIQLVMLNRCIVGRWALLIILQVTHTTFTLRSQDLLQTYTVQLDPIVKKKYGNRG